MKNLGTHTGISESSFTKRIQEMETKNIWISQSEKKIKCRRILPKISRKSEII